MNKKDPNYIAGLEQAVEKKYGSGAVANPAKFWNEEKEEEYKKQIVERAKLLREREEKLEIKEGKGFLVKKKLFTNENRVCPIKDCGKYSFSVRDDVYMTKYGCCYRCYIQYVEDREDKWDARRRELVDGTDAT